jgi:hypothetical protein
MLDPAFIQPAISLLRPRYRRPIRPSGWLCTEVGGWRRWSRRQLRRYHARSTHIRNSLSHQVDAQLIWHLIEQALPTARSAPYRPRTREESCFPPLSSPAILFADHAAPCRQALGGMLLHPLRELRRAHQARLHRDLSEVRGGDGLLAAICRRRETAEHGDDLDHDGKMPWLQWRWRRPLTV